MITILTPTYNRAHTLINLYDSLCAQSCHDFEWLIVDDGSNDGSYELIKNFQQKNTSFEIRLIHQENSGKHVAINHGVRAVNGDWIFIVDSDDVLTVDAVQVVQEAAQDLSDDRYVGICYRRAHFDGSIIGIKHPSESEIISLHPSRAAVILKGDLAYIFKTQIMRDTPFPVIQGEKFVPELYIWNRIGDKGEILYWVNKVIYLCEYLPDGYSNNFSLNIQKNCQGFKLFYQAQFYRESSLLAKLKCVIRIIECQFYALLKKV